jgi:hypothetical protein
MDAMIVVAGISMLSAVSATGTVFLVRTLTNTIDSICTYVGRIAVLNHPAIIEINKILVDIDLKFTIDVVREVVRQYGAQYDKQQANQVENLALHKALIGVNDILEKIEGDLKIVVDAINYHATKYFSQWRSIGCSYSMETIIKNKQILDARYNILVDLLKLNKF